MISLAGLHSISSAADGEPHRASQYRAANQPARPWADGTLVAEAEEFRPSTGSAWQAKPWGENYYAATFANTFLSRKAYLGAPEQCDAEASLQVRIATEGDYLALVRYEAAYRFETQFRLRIEQGGKIVLDRLYGARRNPKIWAFSKKIQPEVAWPWGAVENVVWEGHDARVRLRAGVAKLTLMAARQPAPAAKRNVDVVMLTSRLDDVRQRIEKERYLPLDGLLTQRDDVFLKLHNRGQAETTLTVNKTTEHSPYWVHQREWKPKTVTAAPGKSTDWIEVGGLMDCFNDGQWRLGAKTSAGAALKYEVEFGAADALGKVASIARFPATGATLDLAYDGDTRYSRRIRLADQVLYDLVDDLKSQPTPGKPAQRTEIFGYTFTPKPGDARYNASLNTFLGMFNLATRDLARPGTAARPRGFIDVRGLRTLEQLEAACQKYKSQGLADKIAVVSLGDEIGLPTPPAKDHQAFRAWLQSRRLKPADVSPGAASWEAIDYEPQPDSAASPRLFFYTRRYQHHYGIAQLKKRTDLLRRYLPNAGVGANYSPHHGHPYLGETHKWITLFRQGGMTMPWSEDYIWQVPVGSQQMNFLGLDMFRAALRDEPQGKIYYYVMPHWPGNTPRSWRRQFFGDLAHGMRSVDLFEFRPVQAAYTENYSSLPAMYQTCRRAFHELATFEDIVQEGRPLPGSAALWFSDTADIWDDNSDPFAAGKRTLYIAIRHQQLPLDVVTDDDAAKRRLGGYRVLYLADRHVSRAAARHISDWVAAGGKLFATAGAGLWDEFNQPNETMRELLGVAPEKIETPAEANIVFGKQDLPFAKPLDTVTWQRDAGTGALPVLGARAKFKLAGAKALGAFADGSPAIASRDVGRGATVYCGFLPGLAYFKPAIPLRPVDRGSSDDSMAHFIPTQFDAAAGELVGLLAKDAPRTVVCSQPLVESRVLKSPAGVAIPLVNWSAAPIAGLRVRVNGAKSGKSHKLASGRPLKVETQDGARVFVFDLDVADALILR